MIQHSQSLKNRIASIVVRWTGSEAVLAFYSGEMPADCDDSATGEKVSSGPIADDEIRAILNGREPDLPKDAKFWRLLDNGGLVVMQGDGA